MSKNIIEKYPFGNSFKKMGCFWASIVLFYLAKTKRGDRFGKTVLLGFGVDSKGQWVQNKTITIAQK